MSEQLNNRAFGPTPGTLPALWPEAFAADGVNPGIAAWDSPAELVTPRLKLRRYEASDHQALHRIMSRAETFRYSERGPMSAEESWARLLRHRGHWATLGYGLFAVEERATGVLVGEVGLADFRRGFGTGFDGLPEASWTLVPEYWGRGYALEAAVAAHEWIARSLAPQASVCIIHRANSASIRLALRLGYHPTCATRYCGYDAVMFRREGGRRR